MEEKFENIEAAITYYEGKYHDSLATDDRAFQLANWLRRYKEQQNVSGRTTTNSSPNSRRFDKYSF